MEFLTQGNGNLVTNALENLGGSNDLISVRGRAGFSRPFTLVRSLQQDAEQRFRQKEEALQTRLKATEKKIQELQSREAGREFANSECGTADGNFQVSTTTGPSTERASGGPARISQGHRDCWKVG